MRVHYPFVFVVNEKEYLSIWFTNDNDGFVIEDGKLLIFDNMTKLTKYIVFNDLNFVNEITRLSINLIRGLMESKNEMDCTEMLNFWNTISDLAKSSGTIYLGDSNEFIDIYNKLFYGNNFPAVRGDGELFVPEWETEEIVRLEKIITDGIRVLELML
ncbi:hypothetical protein [Cohnella boryungensis]|uniref:Uncharacterized protein n=1 Tax=Cohnella boryungensis TaxID=768479 RepID=A0ABV8SFQ3_9BACL